MSPPIGSTTIEFHRFGDEADALVRGRRYIRACGFGAPATEVAVTIELKALQKALHRLRYANEPDADREAAARSTLAAEARNFLPDEIIGHREASLHQVDIVSHAAELRAYPFEAIYASAALLDPDQGVVLTRRIRLAFSDDTVPWPEKPSVLFLHARRDRDLDDRLVEQHRQALLEALSPWGSPDRLEKDRRFVTCEVDSVAAIEAVRATGRFDYIHVLAHGQQVDEDDLPDDGEWGIRLGDRRAEAVAPEILARALAPIDHRPLVVTLATCDSGTTQRPELANGNLAEALHRAGVPVVIGSQLPLTKDGSVLFAAEFYRHLLRGTDVRRALHAGRVALQRDPRGERVHDWLALVAYVRLPPEGYAQHLEALGLRHELAMLEVTRKRAEATSVDGPQAGLDAVEQELSVRLQSLEARSASLRNHRDPRLLAECIGLLASAGKSLAELLFTRAERPGADRDALAARARATLATAANHYRDVYRRNPSAHWQGIQHLALEAVTCGRLAAPVDLLCVERIARIACESDASEYWAFGTIVEVLLLRTLDAPLDRDAAHRALRALSDRARMDPNDQGFAAESTRRQLRRYMTWWTKRNGFFPGRSTDLGAAAGELLAMSLLADTEQGSG